jgi:hypothetical protein
MTLANILTASLLLPGMAAGTARDHAARRAAAVPEPSPQVEVRTNRRDDVFERGDRMTVFVRTDVDAYVTIFRVDTDGRARILFPARPYDDNYVRGARTMAVPGARAGYTLRVEEYPGEGFLFAVVTLDPIAFRPFARGHEWDYYSLGLASRVTGDPYVLFSDLLAALVPETYADYGWAAAPYYVGARHEYPRFLCYHCHAYVPPVVWDPYAHTCIRIGVPEPLWWRYPHATYGGTVVVGPPRRLPAGFVVPPRAPVATPGPRDGGRTPGERRPAPVASAPARRPAPVTTAPPARRAAEPADAERRPAVTPPARKDAKPAAVARRPAPTAKAPARTSPTGKRDRPGTTERRRQR